MTNNIDVFSIDVFRMSGAGNLFSVINNNDYKFSITQLEELSKILCNKNEINDFRAEGFLAIKDSTEYDFEVDFFNPDGSTGMMCGNGGRCAIDFAIHHIIKGKYDEYVSFKMAGNIYSGQLNDNGIKIILPKPKEITFNKKIVLDGIEVIGTYVDVSSDHYVINYENLSDFELNFDEKSINNFAPKLRHHNDFGTKGANINIFKKIGNIIYLFTFERGVEAVTGACGTGAISTALHCNYVENLSLPITISPPSGLHLKVDFQKNKENIIENIVLIGHSEVISRDNLNIEL